jgi:hypothetical protein
LNIMYFEYQYHLEQFRKDKKFESTKKPFSIFE